MTKRIIAMLFLVLLVATAASAQAPLVLSKVFTGNASSAAISATGIQAGQLYLTFIKSGTVSGCTATVESSASNAPFSAATVGVAQTCTTTGAYAVQVSPANFYRVTVSSWTGTGSVLVKLVAYPNTPLAVSPVGLPTTNCGTSASCATPVALSGAGLKIAVGQTALASASPSTVTITAIAPAFTSSTSYTCTASPTGNTAAIAAAGIAITYVSGSSFTLTGPNTVTTSINWICVGT